MGSRGWRTDAGALRCRASTVQRVHARRQVSTERRARVSPLTSPAELPERCRLGSEPRAPVGAAHGRDDVHVRAGNGRPVYLEECGNGFAGTKTSVPSSGARAGPSASTASGRAVGSATARAVVRTRPLSESCARSKSGTSRSENTLPRAPDPDSCRRRAHLKSPRRKSETEEQSEALRPAPPRGWLA